MDAKRNGGPASTVGRIGGGGPFWFSVLVKKKKDES